MRLEEFNDKIPSEADIDLVVWGLKGGRVGGPSGMRAKDLKGWIREAKRENDPVSRRWELLVKLVQLEFGDGTVTE